jgi:hypothetical protein
LFGHSWHSDDSGMAHFKTPVLCQDERVKASQALMRLAWLALTLSS